jgi:hypothetical protein
LDGRTLEQYLASRPLYRKPPERLFPSWALEVYRGIHEDLVAEDLSAPISAAAAAGDRYQPH